jgi:hypothetical protein
MFQQVDYYFDEKCIYDTFNVCINLLRNELSTEKACELNELVIIHEITDQKDEYSDPDLFVNCENLKDSIEGIYAHFEISIEQLMIDEFSVRSRISELESRLHENNEEQDTLIESISFECKANSDLETLFLLHYSEKQFIAQLEIGIDENNELINESQIKYEDINYDELTDYVEVYLNESYIIKSFLLDRVSSDETHVDLYYKISEIPDHF